MMPTTRIYNVQSSPTRTRRDAVAWKIRSFSKLPDGWDFGVGKAPSRTVVDKALNLYSRLQRFGLGADAFPIASGGVNVTFYSADHSFEVRVRADSTIDLVHEVGIGVEYEQLECAEDVGQAHVEEVLERFSESKNVICYSSGPLVFSGTMTLAGGVLRATASPTTTVPFLCSDMTAQNPLRAMYAAT